MPHRMVQGGARLTIKLLQSLAMIPGSLFAKEVVVEI